MSDARPQPQRPPPRGRRIGLFGGSFDPVHCAHLALARQALAELELDELRWVPAGLAWQKARALSAAAHRLAMLRLAIGGAAGQVIDERETLRDGPSYTLDTVREWQLAEPDASIFLVIGQDQFAGLHTWHGHAELLRRVTLAVAWREGVRPPADVTVMAAPRRELRMPPMAVSSSGIRERVAAGRDIAALVPAAVAQYIRRHGLYAPAPGSGEAATA